jgi:hypothetical protein
MSFHILHQHRLIAYWAFVCFPSAVAHVRFKFTLFQLQTANWAFLWLIAAYAFVGKDINFLFFGAAIFAFNPYLLNYLFVEFFIVIFLISLINIFPTAALNHIFKAVCVVGNELRAGYFFFAVELRTN